MDRWWDWAGQGWMASENPILIVDSAVPDLVGNNPRTTWLVLDAHHSIPFQQIESTGIYAAPPRFRARLAHNGIWVTHQDGSVGWEDGRKPTRMEVFLYDGALKYTFVIVRADMPQYRWDRSFAMGSSEPEWIPSDLHDRPLLADQFPQGTDHHNGWDPFAHCRNPGLGLPYLGLCVSIEDQNGHQVEINYSGIDQRAVPYTLNDTSGGGTDGNTCTECGQACARKGMIRSVNLKTRGVLRWSLLYAYRGFRGANILVSDEFLQDATSAEDRRFREQDLWGTYQIDRIYVYKVNEGEDGPEERIEDLLNQEYEHYRINGLSLDHTQPLDLNGQGPDPLTTLVDGDHLNDWTHLIQNHYAQRDDDGDGIMDGVWNGALKIMTTVTSRNRSSSDPDPTAPATETVKRWVYHYATENGQSYFDSPLADGGAEDDLRWLSRIYTPEDVAHAVSTKTFGLGGQLTLENLVHMTHPSTSVLLSPSEYRRVANAASVQFQPGQHDGDAWPNDDGSVDAPNGTKLLDASYVVNANDNLATDMQFNVVGSLVLKDDTGKTRYYQINRLRVVPTDFGFEIPTGHPFRLSWSDQHGVVNHRSAFVHPYQWHGYMPSNNTGSGWQDPSTSQPPALTEPRWIIIVDEFAQMADLFPTTQDISDGYGVYTSDQAVKKSQTTRRVVELSPSGYILRDRTWEYGENGVVRSGGGIGEQYIYRTVEDYFDELNHGTDLHDPLPNDDSYLGPNHHLGANSGAVVNDALSNIRTELLTVERRSLGWSVTETSIPPIDGTENGYVSFTAYQAFHPPGESWQDYDASSEEIIPASSRIQPVAAGFYRGTNYVTTANDVGWQYEDNENPRFFTTQWIRDPQVPGDVTAQIDFIEPDNASEPGAILLSALPPPDYSSPPPTRYRVQRNYIERDDSDLDIPEEERPVLSRMIVGVPHQVYPGSSWYYPVEREFYVDGNTVWACTGQLRNPENPSASNDPYESLTFTYYHRDNEGRSLETILDASPGTVPSSADQSSVSIPNWPDGWQRIGAGDALNHVTSFRYDDYAPGLCDIYFPNGRRWARRVVVLLGKDHTTDETVYIEEFAREYIYNDLQKINGHWTPFSDGEVKDYRSTDVFQRPLISRKVKYEGPLPNSSTHLSVTPTLQPEWYVKSAIRLGLDGNGRIQEAALLERSPSGILLAVGSKMINDLGEIYREQEIDETITVQTRNSLGQTLRVYQGTEDRQWYVPHTDQQNYPDPDMILLQRTEYGTGVNDVWQPKIIRHYDANPTWAADLHAPVAPETDTQSRATVIGYDWQARAVRTDQYAKGNPHDGARRMSTTLVYLDFLDRPYLEVTYGADPAAGQPGNALDVADIDPCNYLDAQLFPNANGVFDLQLFYAPHTGQNPVSLVQSLYGINGTLEERRTYDVAWNGTGTAPYLADFTYTSRGGSPSFTQSPGGQVEITRLDSLGRIASTITAVPSTGAFSTTSNPDNLKQLTRIDYRYDADGNVIETANWERVRDTGPELNGTNAVRSRTLSWYNPHKRLVATADLGTESPDGYRYEANTYTHTVPGPGEDLGSVPHWNETTGTVQGLGNLPTTAMVWVYQYDESGNKTLSVDPQGIVTTYEYSATNRLLYETHNAAGTWDESRMSGYRYEYGRLIEMNLVTADNRLNPIGGSSPPIMGHVEPVNPGEIDESQIYDGVSVANRTRLKYGGEIVMLSGHDYYYVSKNNKLIRSMHLPNETTGVPADDAEVFLRYTFSGQIAERYSGSGEAFRYFYDDLDRLIAVETGHWDPEDAYPTLFQVHDPSVPSGGLGVPTPTDKVGFVEYTYDDRGNLSDVHAWTHRDEQTRILISHNRMAYQRDQMVTEWQLHGDGDIDATTPRIDYTWEYEPTNTGEGGSGTARTGHHRVTKLIYPRPDTTTVRRQLIHQYGLDGSETDLLSRLTAMRSSIGTLNLADFTYTGGGRRSALLLRGGQIYKDYRDTTAVGLTGVDAFGRTEAVHFRTGATTPTPGSTLYQANYTHDHAGNRTSAIITQAPVVGQSRDNVRSVLNTYDNLGRLTASRYGQVVLSQDGVTLTIAAGTGVHEDAWILDRLGNWAGTVDPVTDAIISHGRTTTGTLDGFGVPWSLSTHTQYNEYAFGLTQAVDQRHSITSLGLFEMYEDDPQSTAERAITPIYDGAGRLVFDGQYVYQYDHWGRLVQINEADPDPLSPPQDPLDAILSMGPMLKHFVYDGFGRLIRTTSPAPEPDSAPSMVRAVNYYYDGARRVQEILSEDVASIAASQSSGDPQLEALASSSTPEPAPDGSNAPLALQMGQLNPVPYSRNIHREYVWGPGDNGFDEILLQTDELDHEHWCLQDAGGDLVALVKVTANQPAVVRQWTYDAYGAILTAEHLGASLESHIGHKGLFADRLDVGVGAATDPESPRLIPHAHTVYQNRNRAYTPSLGRFLQPDPNQTAMTLLSVTASNARGFGPIALAFSMEGLYGNGLNLYQYLGSNPWTRSDPLGLSWDDEIESLMDELTGGRAAALSQLGKDMEAAAIVAARIMSMLPIPFAGMAGDLALYALGDQSGGELAAALALGIIPGGKLGGALFKSMGGIAGSAFSASAQMAKAGGTALLQGANRLASRAKAFVRRKPGSACGCFTAATMVWTAQGMVPISEIERGQYVYAAQEDAQASDYKPGEVGDTIYLGEASLVKLTVRHQDGSVEVIETTDEHPFHPIHTGEWTRADQLQIGDLLAAMHGTAELIAVEYGLERVPVYNLSIPGSPTYFVGDHGVWVHNCGDWATVIRNATHMFVGRSLDDMASVFDDLAAEGWTKTRTRNGKGWKWESPGRNDKTYIRYMESSSRNDAAHNFTGPYWVFSGDSMGEVRIWAN